ncbi:hypothetical protein AGMMS49942_12010 [Spirochaetia bacterium]|nr:hypothetical protein AGMMS49942_12010 [Spirochaetia bacterium]
MLKDTKSGDDSYRAIHYLKTYLGGVTMNKSRFFSIAAGVGIALLLGCALAGCDFLKNPDYVDSIPLPPELPYATLSQEEDGAHQYKLEWKRASGRLLQDAEYNDSALNEVTQGALDTWREYIRVIDPRPFYDKSGTGLAPVEGAPFEVFNSGGKLDNGNPSGNGNIVIHRYWPKDAAGNMVTPNRIAWLGAVTARAAAFKKAAGEIEGMLAAIEKSPLYTKGSEPLRALHEAMANAISHNPPEGQCVQRTMFSVVGGGTKGVAVLPDGVSGFLYEYYLGHVPDSSGYVNTAPLAFPE